MEFTGERFVPSLTGAIELEHMNRYYFVINQMYLENMVILDIASGEGYGSNLLAQHAKYVYGVDISSETIKHSSSKYIKENLRYIEGDATKIPIENNSIDVVVSFETIEHHDKHIEMIKEIKRVLRPNGILFISSPDKLNYSDRPMSKNEFHVKELYYEEFQNLISGNFKKTIFYSQKIFVGSIILLDDNTQENKKTIVVDKEGHYSEFTPIYNIAIATDNLNFIPKYQSVFYKETDYILTNDDIETAKQTVRLSLAYKIGILMLNPYRKIKLLFKTLIS